MKTSFWWRGVLGGVVGSVCLWGCAGGDEASSNECAGSAGAPQGTAYGVDWIDLKTFEDSDILAECERLCGWSARCTEYDEAICLEQCPGVLAQAREQHCEQSLMTAMQCVGPNLCEAGVPQPPSDDNPDAYSHPCVLQTWAVSCSILPETAEATIFDLFRGDDSIGVMSFANSSSGNGKNDCFRLAFSHTSELRMDCSRSDPDAPWCCSCKADMEPVRAFTSNSVGCPLDGGDTDSGVADRNAKVCGWRF